MEKREYRGIEWTTNKSLSKALDKRPSYVQYFIDKGKTYEEIIDYVLDYKEDIKSYRGIEWTTNKSLSKALGKSDYYVCINLRKGKTYEEIIDIVMDKNIKHYSSVELSIIENIDKEFYSVIYKGKEDVWSFDEILEYIGGVDNLLKYKEVTENAS